MPPNRPDTKPRRWISAKMLIASLPGVPPRRQLLNKYRILLTYCPVFDLAALGRRYHGRRRDQREGRQEDRASSLRLARRTARTWQVDLFVTGSLGLVVHDFGARIENPVPIAVVALAAASAAA